MEKDIINIVVWACIGALGIACSYYSSSYIASGIVHVSNSYFNLNLNSDSIESLVMGSLCFTVFLLVTPHMADSVINIMVSGIDQSVYSAAYQSSVWSNDLIFMRDIIKPVSRVLGNPEAVSVLNSVLQQHQNNFELLHPVLSTLFNYEFTDHLEVILRNKIHDSSIYIPEIFNQVNGPLFAVYRNGDIFYQIPEDILIQDSPLIRGIYLSDMLMYDNISAELLANMEPRFYTDRHEFVNYFDMRMCANVQLLDTLYRVGSGTNVVSPFELLMRTQMADFIFPLQEGQQVFQVIDGSMIDANDIIIRDKILILFEILMDDSVVDKVDWFAESVMTPEDIILIQNESIDDA